MRMTKMYFRTLREVPAEAEIPSHVWLLRAGMIRKLVSGIYGFMPLGLRVLRKIEDIVREEMNAKGAHEILMSAIQPAELWQESGRWYAYGPEMWRMKDRNERDFCLGPTHEEVFTDIVRNEVDSYRQLPFNLYQIQTKYRDEKRPRFGLMRSREFIMKDAYSFDRDWEGLDKSYDEMFDAYTKIFKRCSLAFKAVEADVGAMGGSASHEFCALSDHGESEIVHCEKCGMAATREQAPCVDDAPDNDPMLPAETVFTPKTKTIAQVASYLGIRENKTIKALLFRVYDQKDYTYAAAFVRGDRELNVTKLVNALRIPEHAVEFADEAAMHEETGSVGGFTGPIGLRNCKIVVDTELIGSRNMCCGANKEDRHMINVNYGRDYTADIVAELKLIQKDYACHQCGAPLSLTRGIEVGQVFKLGTKYSESMHAYYKDENMSEKPVVMGCYGIGVSRTLAAIVEQHHDKDGIRWPVSVAPYHVIITLVNKSEPSQVSLSEDIYRSLSSKGVEVLLDDRDERPGVKFKDADLIGIPLRINVGKKAALGIVEFRERTKPDSVDMTAKEAEKAVVAAVREALTL